MALSLEHEDPAVERLIGELQLAEQSLAERAPDDLAPRVGSDQTPGRRVYIGHSQDIGSYNPCFPDYAMQVAGEQAKGTVDFPLTYEGPPGIVHGGFLAVFFDCVIQDHNCQVGQAGKTVSLALSYHRPTPVITKIDFEIDRSVIDRRIKSTARLMLEGVTLCTATMDAVAGDRARLPEVSPRRSNP